MKIAFFSEAGYIGKVSRDNPNMRTDVAWVCALDATHHPISTIHELPDNSYDVGIMILPKKREPLLNYPLLEQYKRVCKKVSIMQESYYNYWQDSSIEEQIWYFNFITEMDLIFCHNDIDAVYYNGLTNVRTELLPSVMITDDIVKRSEWGDATIIGGNFVWAYGGFDSYQVARELGDDVHAVTTGRMKPEEEHILKHIPWVSWREWIDILSQFNVGVQLGTAAAGTFSLNCAYHGIPCIGYSNVDTQRICHPKLTVDVGDIESARKLAVKLKEDKDFYKECSQIAMRKYKECFDEEVYIYTMKKVIEEVIST